MTNSEHNTKPEAQTAAGGRVQALVSRARWTWSLGGNGSGGFGFGVWRNFFHNAGPIWTVAIGPLSIYIATG